MNWQREVATGLAIHGHRGPQALQLTTDVFLTLAFEC